MNNGIMGRADLLANKPFSIATCDFEEPGAATVTVNLVNRNNETVKVWIAVNTTLHEMAAIDAFVEYELELEPNAVVERSGILLKKDEYVTVKSDTSNVSATAWGSSYGSDSTDPVLYITGEVTALADGAATTVYLGREATVLGDVTYTVESGTPPTGLTLNSTTGALEGTMPTTGYSASGTQSNFTVSATSGSKTESKTIFIRKIWGDGTQEDRPAASAEDAADLRTIGGPTQIWIDPEAKRKPFQIYAASSLSELMTVPASASRPAWVTNITGLNIISRSIIDQQDTMLIEIDDYHRLIRHLFDPTVDSGTTPYFYWAIENSSTNTLIGITRTRFYNTDYAGWQSHHNFGDRPDTLAPYGGDIVPEWNVWGTSGLPSGSEYVITNDTSEHVRSIPYRNSSAGYSSPGSYGLHYKRTDTGEHYPWRNGNDVNTSEGYFFPSSSNSLAGVANLRHYIFVSQT
jgi:hypothetical protein